MTDEELKALFGQVIAQLDDLRRHFHVMKEDVDRKLAAHTQSHRA